MCKPDLLSRLQSATGPSRELDARIWAEHDDRDIVGPQHSATWRDAYFGRSRKAPNDECFLWQPGRTADHVPRHTESIDAKLPGEDIIGTSEQNARPGQPIKWMAIQRRPKGRMPVSAIAHTEAIARRLACLIAIERAKEDSNAK